VGGPPPIMELMNEPSDGPADVVCAADGGERAVDEVEVYVEGGSETGGGGMDVEEGEADVGGGSEAGDGGFEVVDNSDSGTVTGGTLLT
jgi:hypothetical protein